MLVTSITMGWLVSSSITASGKFGSNVFVYLKASLGFGVYLLILFTYISLLKLYLDIPIKNLARSLIIPL